MTKTLTLDVLSCEVLSLCHARAFAFVRSCFVLKIVFPFWTYSISPLEVHYLNPAFLFTSSSFTLSHPELDSPVGYSVNYRLTGRNSFCFILFFFPLLLAD